MVHMPLPPGKRSSAGVGQLPGIPAIQALMAVVHDFSSPPGRQLGATRKLPSPRIAAVIHLITRSIQRSHQLWETYGFIHPGRGTVEHPARPTHGKIKQVAIRTIPGQVLGSFQFSKFITRPSLSISNSPGIFRIDFNVFRTGAVSLLFASLMFIFINEESNPGS